MIGAVVTHKIWGIGTVIEQTASTITVCFDIGSKKFEFPSAFDNHLVTEDSVLLTEISEKKKTIEAKKQSMIIQTIRSGFPKPEKKRKITRSVERSNVAFKCNYCDGGSSDICVGFKGVCSDEMIHYNIENAKHIWCGSDSPCRKYLDGEISRSELEVVYNCYESKMLTEWKTGAGIVQNGVDKGKPMKLLKVQNNSLCILTTRLPNTADDARFIFAVFLVDESYEGDGREEGYVTNHSKWRIELTPDEAQKMLFWNYYVNKNKPDKIVFGSGLHRYLDDIQAAQILRDIVVVKEGKENRKLAEDFFHHFCMVVGLEENDIPPCAGALKRG
jgi:hypothetical protein